MTDYLSNLASKSLNLTAVIYPRPVSLFEPPPLARWSASGHSFGLETVGGEEASGEAAFDAPSPASLPASQPAAPGLSVADLRLPPERRAQQPDDLPLIPAWRSRQSTGLQSPIRAPAVPQSTETRPKPPVSQPGRAQVQPALSQTPGRLSPPAPPHLDGPTFPLTAPSDEAAATPSWGSAEDGDRRAPEPAVRQILIQRVLSAAEPPPPLLPRPEPPPVQEMGHATPGTIVAQPQTRSYTEAEPPSPFEAVATPKPSPTVQEMRHATPGTIVARPETRSYIEAKPPAHFELPARREPPPTIQVTIGRIEVRATPPPTPAAKKQRPKPPAMSLDEYLRKRAKGGGG